MIAVYKSADAARDFEVLLEPFEYPGRLRPVPVEAQPLAGVVQESGTPKTLL